MSSSSSIKWPGPWLTWAEMADAIVGEIGCTEVDANHLILRASQEGYLTTDGNPHHIRFHRRGARKFLRDLARAAKKSSATTAGSGHVDAERAAATSPVERPSVPIPTPAGKAEPKKRGPLPKEIVRVVTAMRESKHTIEELSDWSREALAEEFKTSPSTARRARKKLRAENSVQVCSSLNLDKPEQT